MEIVDHFSLYLNYIDISYVKYLPPAYIYTKRNAHIIKIWTFFLIILIIPEIHLPLSAPKAAPEYAPETHFFDYFPTDYLVFLFLHLLLLQAVSPEKSGAFPYYIFLWKLQNLQEPALSPLISVPVPYCLPYILQNVLPPPLF